MDYQYKVRPRDIRRSAIERDCTIDTLALGQNGRHFANDIFKCIILNENIWIRIIFSLKLAAKGQTNNISALL